MEINKTQCKTQVPGIRWTSCPLPKEDTSIPKENTMSIPVQPYNDATGKVYIGTDVFNGLLYLAGIDPDSELALKIRENRARLYEDNIESREECLKDCFDCSIRGLEYVPGGLDRFERDLRQLPSDRAGKVMDRVSSCRYFGG